MEEGYITTDDGVRLFYQKIGDSPETVIIPCATKAAICPG